MRTFGLTIGLAALLLAGCKRAEAPRQFSQAALDQALADPAYALPENYVGRGGFSWIHRWSRAKGMPNKGEPDPPAWVTEGFAKR